MQISLQILKLEIKLKLETVYESIPDLLMSLVPTPGTGNCHICYWLLVNVKPLLA
jgi:hypothetical protein